MCLARNGVMLDSERVHNKRNGYYLILSLFINDSDQYSIL